MEEWKDIDGYEGLYQISNLGRVKSLKFGKEKILKPRKNKTGYLYIGLHKEGKFKLFLIHRLVAQVFIKNLDNLPQVNHKDEDKLNNISTNLEWCNREYNCNFGSRNKRSALKRINHPTMSKKVLCVETGVVYPSTRDAERETGIHNGNISYCCNGHRKTAGKFHWQFA